MDENTYRLEEAVLFNRYRIIGYSIDSPDTDSTPVGTTPNPDLPS